MRSFIFLLAVATMAHAQEAAVVQPDLAPFASRAVNTVLMHNILNPQPDSSTSKIISSSGKWSIERKPATGCAPDAAACVTVLFSLPEDQIVCHWVVQIAADATADTILSEDDAAAKYLAHKAKPEEADSLLGKHAKIKPIYPAIARAAHVGGKVSLQLVVAPSGEPSHLSVVDGPPMLQGAALEAVRTVSFAPFLIGQTTISWMTYIVMDFSIHNTSGGIPDGVVTYTFTETLPAPKKK